MLTKNEIKSTFQNIFIKQLYFIFSEAKKYVAGLFLARRTKPAGRMLSTATVNFIFSRKYKEYFALLLKSMLWLSLDYQKQ